MKKIRLLIMALAIATMAGLYSCGPSQENQEQEGEPPGMEEIQQNTEEKTREMIEQAEEMEEADTIGY